MNVTCLGAPLPGRYGIWNLFTTHANCQSNQFVVDSQYWSWETPGKSVPLKHAFAASPVITGPSFPPWRFRRTCLSFGRRLPI